MTRERSQIKSQGGNVFEEVPNAETHCHCNRVHNCTPRTIFPYFPRTRQLTRSIRTAQAMSSDRIQSGGVITDTLVYCERKRLRAAIKRHTQPSIATEMGVRDCVVRFPLPQCDALRMWVTAV